MNPLETPRSGEGKLRRQTRGCGYFAQVRVEVAATSGESRIEIALVDDPSYYAPANEWITGATHGAEFALRAAGARNVCVTVRNVFGTDCDTNATIAAAASAFAVWNALEFVPSPELLARIEEHVFTANWQTPADFDQL